MSVGASPAGPHAAGRPDGIAGRVALVTGAARGIGAAVAHTLAGLGAHVAAVDVDETGAQVTAKQLPAAGVPALGLRADVADAADVATAVARTEEQLGPIDILVSVAGVLRPATVLATSDEDWAYTMGVNATGVFQLAREVGRGMRARRRGCIVTVGSNAAGVPRTGMAAYAASKAAATMLTRCLGLELAPYGVRCNIVSPGSTDTPMQRALWADATDGTDGNDDAGAHRVIAGSPAEFKVGIPLGRIAEPQDIADAVAFLASDRARHITMHDLYVDGGATLRA